MNTSSTATTLPDGQISDPLYQSLPGIYDEMMGRNGGIAPAWKAVASWFEHTSPTVQVGCAQKIERLVFENFFDPQRGRQTWRLDLFPLIFNASTWALIERAAIQRAQLYNAILADLYGPMEVFSRGLVPPALIHSDESFLRPVHGLTPEKGTPHIHGA